MILRFAGSACGVCLLDRPEEVCMSLQISAGMLCTGMSEMSSGNGALIHDGGNPYSAKGGGWHARKSELCCFYYEFAPAHGSSSIVRRRRLEAAYEIMPQGALAAPMLAELDLRPSVESITVSWAGVCGSDSQTCGAIHRQSALHPSRTEAGIQPVCPPYHHDAITLRGRSRPTGSRAGPVRRRTRHPACFLCARGGIRSS
jgi:hypothetical protein